MRDGPTIDEWIAELAYPHWSNFPVYVAPSDRDGACYLDGLLSGTPGWHRFRLEADRAGWAIALAHPSEYDAAHPVVELIVGELGARTQAVLARDGAPSVIRISERELDGLLRSALGAAWFLRVSGWREALADGGGPSRESRGTEHQGDA